MPAEYSVKVYDAEGFLMSPRMVRPAFYDAVTEAAQKYVDAKTYLTPTNGWLEQARERLAKATKELANEIEAVRKHNLIIEKAQKFVQELDVDSL